MWHADHNKLFSGQTEYLSEIKNLVHLLDYELQPVEILSECGRAAHGANWAVASSVSVSEAMQAVKENIGEWRQRAKLASDTYSHTIHVGRVDRPKRWNHWTKQEF